MGVSVRQKDGKWYTFTRYQGKRKAHQYDSEEEARAVAQALRNAIALGDFDKFFNHSRKRKLITDNPASGSSQLYSQAKPKHAKIEPLTKKEVPLFLAAVKQHSPNHYALFV